MENNLEREYTPTEYFEYIKSKKNKTSDEELKKVYNNCMILLDKYIRTGQVAFSKKLIFQIETIEKERKLVNLGIDTFVYKDDIEDFIDDVSSYVVKIIELENYEREIPDEIVEKIEKTKGLFTQLYVVFTDYSKKAEKAVEQKRREKDPILFGSFQDVDNRVINDRFYFLGDWVDEYCDLTLDKMVRTMKERKNKNIKNEVKTPINIKELKSQLSKLEKAKAKNDFRITNVKRKVSFFERVKNIFK